MGESTDSPGDHWFDQHTPEDPAHGTIGMPSCGSLSRATFHVFVREDGLSSLPAPAEMEDEMLYGAAADREENSRLWWQIRVGERMDPHATTPDTQI